MNLQQTIAELEQKAQEYTEAANRLRALQADGSRAGDATAANPPAATQSQASKGSKKGASKRTSAKKGKSGQKRVVSPETRAKIAAAIKASHAAKKAAG